MGTRSNITVHRTDGKWARIYCHWDGYISYNGKILFENYKTQKKNEQLVRLGYLSSLGELVGKKHPFDKPPRHVNFNYDVTNPAYLEYDKKYGRMCTAYGRDRGEKDTKADIFDLLVDAWPEPDTDAEFIYVWTEGKWFVGRPNDGLSGLIPLSDAVVMDDTLNHVAFSRDDWPFLMQQRNLLERDIETQVSISDVAELNNEFAAIHTMFREIVFSMRDELHAVTRLVTK